MILVVWKCPIGDFNQVCVEIFCGVYPFSYDHGVITLIERKLILEGPIPWFWEEEDRIASIPCQANWAI